MACVISAHTAGACGGIFVPSGSAQLVTDNRMVLSISSQQTTLWTQPRYTGRTEDFAWVFPLRYTDDTQVVLADDAFIRVTEALTAPWVRPPSPVQTTCDLSTDGGRGGSFDGSIDGGVIVKPLPPIGPYAAVVLRGSDPMALRTWLQTNGYAVPTTIESMLAYYTSQALDFIAFRLRPEQDINRFPPVRITMPGAVTRLPLRMIAAGAGERVRLRLVIFSAGRAEAMNFPNGEMTNSDLVWDWSQANPATVAFTQALQRLNARNGGRLWLTETARSRARAEWIEASMRGVTLDGGSDDGGTGDGGAPPTASASDDIAAAFAPHGDRAYVTRLTADLAVSLLDRDLDLAASVGGDRSETYGPGRELNRPAAATCDPSEGCNCRAGNGRVGDTGRTLLALFATLAWVLAMPRRRSSTLQLQELEPRV